MESVYEFVSGPMVWIAFTIFIVGSIARIVMFYNLSRQKDAIIYKKFKSDWALKSILHFLLPLNITARTNPVVTTMGFVYHISFLAIAILLSAHVVLWEQAWGVSWWSLPDAVADWLTVIFLLAALFFILRRAFVPRVRILTTGVDWLVMTLAVLPFITGFIAYHQWLDYELMLILHIASANILLMAIPVTKLSHMYMFFVSRAVTGSDFGKRAVGAW
jgi:nitrate reductase gamma subunit